MKILLISASPRGQSSTTLRLAREVARATQALVSEVQLSQLRIGFCQACNFCHRKIMNCPLKDDAFSVLHKMLESDGIILATPNYLNQVTGPLKTLMDRSSHFVHCLRLLGKYVAGVVTSGGGQDEPVLNYLKEYANFCGAQYSGGVSAQATAAFEKFALASNLGQRLAEDIQKKSVYPEQARLIEKLKKHFGQLIELRKNEWVEEYAYWKKQLSLQ
ncbi:MAG: flavodoxin family protein [Candidatus Omnitrophica bacterium]|nr:flavodoxin family protein [Candidatus Omnitrophota bacterium]